MLSALLDLFYLSLAHTHPLISIHESLTSYELFLFELELLIKCLNVNWEKIQLIILSVTCHSLRNLPLLIHPFMIHPTPSWPTPPLHDPPHPTPTWPTPPYPTPPHLTHHTPPHPTLPHPTPGTFFEHKGAFFHGLLHCVSLSVDKNVGLIDHLWQANNTRGTVVSSLLFQSQSSFSCLAMKTVLFTILWVCILYIVYMYLKRAFNCHQQLPLQYWHWHCQTQYFWYCHQQLSQTQLTTAKLHSQKFILVWIVEILGRKSAKFC